MTWLDHLACALVDQAAIQSVPAEGSGPVQEVPSEPVTCACGRTAESEAEAIAKWWARTWSGWRCAGCNAPSSATVPNETAMLRAHLAAVLAIVTEIGGYLSQEHQDAIRQAREAVR